MTENWKNTRITKISWEQFLWIYQKHLTAFYLTCLLQNYTPIDLSKNTLVFLCLYLKHWYRKLLSKYFVGSAPMIYSWPSFIQHIFKLLSSFYKGICKLFQSKRIACWRKTSDKTIRNFTKRIWNNNIMPKKLWHNY